MPLCHSILIQQRDIFSGSAFRARLQVRKNIGQLLIGNYFARVGRHLSGRLPDVSNKRFLRQERRSNARPGSLRGALPFVTVALVATVLRKYFFSGLRISC